MTMLKDRPGVVRPPELEPGERRPIPQRRLRQIMGWTVLALFALAGAVALVVWLIPGDTDTSPATTLFELPSGEYLEVPRPTVGADIGTVIPATRFELPSGEFLDVPRPTAGVVMPATTFIELPSGEFLEVPAMRLVELPSGEFLEVPLSDADVGGLVDPSTHRP